MLFHLHMEEALLINSLPYVAIQLPNVFLTAPSDSTMNFPPNTLCSMLFNSIPAVCPWQAPRPVSAQQLSFASQHLC